MRDLTPEERDVLKRLSAKIQRHLKPGIIYQLDMAILIGRKDGELIQTVVEELLVDDLSKKRVSPSKAE